jgi:hypothetical protein
MASVMTAKLLASRRASSSCHLPGAGRGASRLRSPVAAISPMVAVMARSGRVTVRAMA